MPIKLDTFRNLAGSTSIYSRDIVVDGEGKKAVARLGNFIISHGKAANNATMAAFKEALKKEYGVAGAHAFDMVLGTRNQLNKSLRACDVLRTLSVIPSIKENRFVGEMNRQLDTSPKIMRLSKADEKTVRDILRAAPLNNIDLENCKKPADLNAAVARRIDQALDELRNQRNGQLETGRLGARKSVETAAKANEATGLRDIKNTAIGSTEGSIEDRVKSGVLGVGMTVNRSSTSAMRFSGLKTYGVEPGFIFRNDWTADDTRGLMADINSEASRAELQALKDNDPDFARRCGDKPLREQIMLAGRAHSAGIAAVAEFLLEEAAKIVEQGQTRGNGPLFDLARAIRKHFPLDNDIRGLASGNPAKALLAEAKSELFAQIRDAVMGVTEHDDFYRLSPIFQHFDERNIMKLDYNEGDRFVDWNAAHEGSFQRPERYLAKHNSLTRYATSASADDISAGAVAEALANDLTRLAGVPAQELQIVRGKYSDGHPKLMLRAKFSSGYQDMEQGFIQDGRVIGDKVESLGKYKAFFLLLADRDAIGRRGQNKGFVTKPDGERQFFAIDPGHSLEGTAPDLNVSDDLSFEDTGFVRHFAKRFSNYSVFDDDTRFSKISGLVQLRTIRQSGAFETLFDNYKTAFNPTAQNISDAERALRTKICAAIDKKRAEFNASLDKLINVCASQLALYDALADDGRDMQEKAINTISHLEMLTSPTTWASKKGKVALRHLEVKPETRVPWRAEVEGDNLVFHCDKPLDQASIDRLQALASSSGATFARDNRGRSTLTISKAQAEHFFNIFSEDNVQKLTHPEEYAARKANGALLQAANN